MEDSRQPSHRHSYHSYHQNRDYNHRPPSPASPSPPSPPFTRLQSQDSQDPAIEPPPPHPPYYHSPTTTRPGHQTQPGAVWKGSSLPQGGGYDGYGGGYGGNGGGASFDTAYEHLLAQKQAAYSSLNDKNPQYRHPSPYSDHNNGGYPPPQHQQQQHPPPHPHPQHHHHYPPPHEEETMVELGPGMYSRLRGAKETWRCVEQDFHIPVTCFACSLELCCIQDASYVLCPSCRTVSPVDQGDSGHNISVNHMSGGGGGNNTTSATTTDGGVGLGFTFDDLFKWQGEIVRRRRAAAEQRKYQTYQRSPPPQQQQQQQHYHSRNTYYY